MAASYPRYPASDGIDGLSRWAATLGTTIAASSLGLVALADSGWFRAWLALPVVLGATAGAALVWRPPVRIHFGRPGPAALLCVLVLAVGAALIAPGSENIAGPRDQAVYLATGFAIASGGSTILHDPVLERVVSALGPDEINSWLYSSAINGARIRFPAQLFIRNAAEGTIEGGFLPVLPVWIAVASSLGLEAALHLAGVFGVLALAFAMLAARDGLRAGWAAGFVGAILALSFSQAWWAREPMAEAALGAFTWLAAWSAVRWLSDHDWRWAALASLATTSALFTRADGILLAVAVGLLLLRYDVSGRLPGLAILICGIGAAATHNVLVSPIYISTTYGAVTLGRAAVGAVGVALLIAGIVVVPRLADWPALAGVRAAAGAHVPFIRRGIALVLLGFAAASVASGLAPGVGRAPGLGAASPLAWLPGYVSWPLLTLAAVGVAFWAWDSRPRGLVPLLLVGGLPALLYLPDPLVTGDHPWMARRLVPAVMPLLAIASISGALFLWSAPILWRTSLMRVAGPLVALLLGSGLGLQLAKDADLFGPRHAAGAIDGLSELAANLPADAVVLFPAGTAGNQLAMPLDMVFGRQAFALPARTINPSIARGIAGLNEEGRDVFWAEDGPIAPVLPEGATAVRTARTQVRYSVADNGPVPPPLQLRAVEHDITLYRLAIERSPS